MKTKTTLVVLASVLLVLGVLGVVVGDSDSANVNAAVTVPGVISITSVNGSLNFGSLEPGESNTTSLDLVVDSNAGYNVEAKSEEENFDKDNSYDTTISASNLEWNNSESWVGYTTNYAEVDTGNAGSDNPHSINHQLTIPSEAESGSYDLDITIKVATS